MVHLHYYDNAGGCVLFLWHETVFVILAFANLRLSAFTSTVSDAIHASSHYLSYCMAVLVIH